MKQQYRVRNWFEYNAALKQRGSLTFWFSEEVLQEWMYPEPTGATGAPYTFSNIAIETLVIIKSLYHLAGRQATGFVASLFELMGIKLSVPDHSTISRRMRKLSISLPVTDTTDARPVVVDSTGIKVYGEGEWKVRPSTSSGTTNMVWANAEPG